MTPNLNQNQLAFIRMMTQSEEAETDGFSILSRREDAPRYFDALVEAGLISPDKNKGPIPANGPKYVQIPFWPGLNYLQAVAAYSGEKQDLALASKIANTLIMITHAASKEAGTTENYHTWWKFADIAALLPLSAISDELIDLLPTWLGSRYDQGTIGSSLSQGLIPKLLSAEGARYHTYALAVIGHITSVLWVVERGTSGKAKTPRMALEDFWVREVVNRHLPSLAQRLPKETTELFTKRVREIFGRGTRAKASWLFRPAVEKHEQNRDWNNAENVSVGGLRDALLVWSETNVSAVQKYIAALYRSRNEMLRRVAIHILNARFDLFRDVLPKFLDEQLFASGLTHEGYGLLSERFAEFGEADCVRVFDLIMGLKAREGAEDPEKSTLYIRRLWLSAINGKGLPAADAEYQRIVTLFGPPGPNPDFLSYMSSRWGHGPAKYSKAELISFLLAGTLVDELIKFVPGDSWNGPTTEALVDELQQSITDRPEEFLAVREDMRRAPRAFQYAYLNAFSRLWGSPSEQASTFDWTSAWPALLDWMLAVIGPAAFWAESISASAERALEPNRDWMAALVADFLRAGMTRDDHSFAPELLPKARELIDILLGRLETEEIRDTSDPMTYAINTRRGRAIEALFSYALRSARVADKAEGGHARVWSADLEPLFNKEIARLPNGNAEFVVLFGHYVPQLQYLSADWAEANFPKIFDKAVPENISYGLSGMSYAMATRPLYQLMSRTSVLDTALAMNSLRPEARESLIQRLTVAYLNGDEALEGPRMSPLFTLERLDDLDTAASYLWGIREQNLDKAQIEMIVAFWRRAIDFARSLEAPPAGLTGDLGRVVCYLDGLNSHDGKRILWLAAYADADQHRGWFFVKELERLVNRDPPVVAQALLTFVKNFRSGYDFENRILNTTRRLAELGGAQRQIAVEIANHLKNLPEFLDLYREFR